MTANRDFFRSEELLFTHYFIQINSIVYIILRSDGKILIFTTFVANPLGSIRVKYLRSRVRIPNLITISFPGPFFMEHPVLHVR